LVPNQLRRIPVVMPEPGVHREIAKCLAEDSTYLLRRGHNLQVRSLSPGAKFRDMCVESERDAMLKTTLLRFAFMAVVLIKTH
jgi:hypothetical protein